MLFLIPKHVVNVKKINKAITLLETLVALSLGSIILFAASQLYSEIYFAQTKYRELFKLQKNAHQILNYLQQHILNMGYQGINRERSNFDWFKVQNSAYHVEEHCLVLIQDINADGCLGTRVKKQCSEQALSIAKDVGKEILAIKLEHNNLMIAGKQNSFTPCLLEQCKNWLKECKNFQWEKIAALSDNRIERLHFSWEKRDKLLKIDLILSSLKNSQIQYHTIAYAYLLNGE